MGTLVGLLNDRTAVFYLPPGRPPTHGQPNSAVGERSAAGLQPAGLTPHGQWFVEFSLEAPVENALAPAVGVRDFSLRNFTAMGCYFSPMRQVTTNSSGGSPLICFRGSPSTLSRSLVR
jgi:hypothetical protein